MNGLIFAGPDKVGSTWFFDVFKTHASVHAPRSKEVFFFDRYFDRGEDWYRSIYRAAEPGQFWLDASHDYLFHERVPERVRSVFSGRVVVVVGVRDPIERAYSAFLFMQSQGRVPKNMGFSEALVAVPELLGHGNYSLYLPRWMDAFEDVVLMRLDDLVADPIALARELERKMRLPADPACISRASVAERNAARSARSAMIARAGRSMLWRMRDRGLHGMAQRLKSVALGSAVLFSPTPDHQRLDLAPFRRQYRSSVLQAISVLRELDQTAFAAVAARYED